MHTHARAHAIRDDEKLAQLVRARDCQSRCHRFDSGKTQKKTENSNLHGLQLHRPSSKGIKLLFQVMIAIKIQCQGLVIESRDLIRNLRSMSVLFRSWGISERERERESEKESENLDLKEFTSYIWLWSCCVMLLDPPGASTLEERAPFGGENFVRASTV